MSSSTILSHFIRVVALLLGYLLGYSFILFHSSWNFQCTVVQQWQRQRQRPRLASQWMILWLCIELNEKSLELEAIKTNIKYFNNSMLSLPYGVWLMCLNKELPSFIRFHKIIEK